MRSKEVKMQAYGPVFALTFLSHSIRLGKLHEMSNDGEVAWLEWTTDKKRIPE